MSIAHAGKHLVRQNNLPSKLRAPCRGDTRPARGSKLTLLSQRGENRFARTVDGYHPSIRAHVTALGFGSHELELEVQKTHEASHVILIVDTDNI